MLIECDNIILCNQNPILFLVFLVFFLDTVVGDYINIMERNLLSKFWLLSSFFEIQVDN